MTDVQSRTSTAPQHEEPAATNAVPTRRAVLTGAGALGTTCLLAACGTANSNSTTPATPAVPADKAAPAGSAAAPGGDSSEPLALVADVPVGSAVIKGAYVISQPTAGEFKAFSKICTHQGCPVTEVDGAVVNCKCHGSSFSIEDGSVKGGPAKKPLPEKTVKRDGDNIVLA